MRSSAAHEGTRHSMKVGYARVSTEDQSLDAQRDQLRADGCTRVFEEKITGRKDRRPALDQALALLQPGDTLVVWKLDRLGRSVKNLTTILHDLDSRGVCFRSISDGIDTGTPTGKLMFHMLGAIAEFEAALVSERTKIGLQAAKQRGKRLGRPRRLEAHQVRQAELLRTCDDLTCADVAARFKVGRTTLWRSLAGSSCMEYAHARGYKVIETFMDDASGSLINRPGMKMMLGFLKKHRSAAPVVLIDDISRLARGMKAHIELRAAISLAGGVLESPSIEFGDDADSVLTPTEN